MKTPVYLLHGCPVRLWGLTSRERLGRMLAKIPDVRLCDADEPLPTQGEVVLLREDYLYDDRVLRGLMGMHEVALKDPRTDTIIAVHASVDRLAHEPSLDSAAACGLRTVVPDSVATSIQIQLRKFDPPWVARITPDNQAHLSKSLFNGSYKGVTDFITRGIWPIPARWATAWCVRKGLSPNQVTAVSYVLALAAGILFWHGHFGTGLLAGWLMTFLDTVDGKLARVTVTSTRFGNIFDHGLDLIHPPLWYFAWGMGLEATWQLDVSLNLVLWLMFLGYVSGRLCEGAFKFVAPFSLFLWRPFDSLNRLVTARRNPNLLILSWSWTVDADDMGLILVTVWTCVSTLILGMRTISALVLKRRGQPVQPWLSRVDMATERDRLIVRLFAPRSGLNDA
jgi:phosphatidylglycerophosphate synthase